MVRKAALPMKEDESPRLAGRFVQRNKKNCKCYSESMVTSIRLPD